MNDIWSERAARGVLYAAEAYLGLSRIVGKGRWIDSRGDLDALAARRNSSSSSRHDVPNIDQRDRILGHCPPAQTELIRPPPQARFLYSHRRSRRARGRTR